MIMTTWMLLIILNNNADNFDFQEFQTQADCTKMMSIINTNATGGHNKPSHIECVELQNVPQPDKS